MADADTCRLCVQIVRSHFGPLAAVSFYTAFHQVYGLPMCFQNVASALLTRGRLSLAQLTRYTKMKPRSVRAAILVLVQHNILWHSNTEEEGEMLEFNTLDCLMRLRFGRFVWQAEQLFGPSVRHFLLFVAEVAYGMSCQGAEIVQLILDHGKLQPPDLISKLSIYNPKSAELFSNL
jgi:DNA-directed RNA polymerase III subunit RPC3